MAYRFILCLLLCCVPQIAWSADANAATTSSNRATSQPLADSASAPAAIAPEATPAPSECSIETLCLSRADLTLLMAARAFRDVGYFRLAIEKYRALISKHPSSPFLKMAQTELIAVRNAPVHTGPVALKTNQTPRRSGTFTGILLGGSLSAVTALGIFGVIDENLEEPTIIAAVLAAGGGAYYSSRYLKKNPETLGVMDSATLGAIWLPVFVMMNLSAHDFEPSHLTMLTISGAAIAGSAGGYRLAKHLNLHAGAATLAYSGAVIGAVELALLQNSFFGDSNDDKRFTALVTLGSIAGMVGGAWWAHDRRFSVGRGRIMTVSAWAAAGLTVATLSMVGIDDDRALTAASAAAIPIGAAVGYFFTEEVEKTEPLAGRSGDQSLAWAVAQAEDHSSQ